MSEAPRVNECDEHAFDRSSGMTILDYFAAAALTGMLADHEEMVERNLSLPDGITSSTARGAYNFARAMMEERSK